jgi:hypothetical protein
MHTEFLSENIKEREIYRDIKENNIIEYPTDIGCNSVYCIHFSETSPTLGSCCMKGEEFIGYLSGY